MLRQLRNIWHPENFHLQHMIGRGKPCFEGWYFKIVDVVEEQPYAIIPGVFLGDDAHAFIQVLDGTAGMSAYYPFPLSEFRAAKNTLDVEIGRSRFSRSGIKLDIPAYDTVGQQAVRGEIHFSAWTSWPVTIASPGVMGPYSFMPFMECNHGILSMDHAVSGELQVNGKHVSFDGGRGYIEKDWGRGFPRGYVWGQSNHFDEPGVSVSASVARIPWLSRAFRGHLVGFLLRDRLYRFATYSGSEIVHISVDEHSYSLAVRDKEYLLEINATRTEGGILHAPYEKQMLERVAESMTSIIDVRFERIKDSSTLFEGSGSCGCLEVQGDLDSILHA